MFLHRRGKMINKLRDAINMLGLTEEQCCIVENFWHYIGSDKSGVIRTIRNYDGKYWEWMPYSDENGKHCGHHRRSYLGKDCPYAPSYTNFMDWLHAVRTGSFETESWTFQDPWHSLRYETENYESEKQVWIDRLNDYPC